MRDKSGRAYVLAFEACGGAASFDDGDLRLYSCPVAQAKALPPALSSLYAASQGGLSPEALGHTALTRGAVKAVGVLAEAWRWRREIEAKAERDKRAAEGRGRARR